MGEETKQPSAWDKFDSKMGVNHPELWKILKWVAVGFIANVPELGVYMLCLYSFRALDVMNLSIFGFVANLAPEKAGFSTATVVYAYMISTAIGYAIAFVLNRKATFHADSNIALSTFLYVLMVCLILYVTAIIGPVTSDLVGKLGLPFNLSEMISKFLCMIANGLWSYPIVRFVIHRKKKVTADA
jgi:putative flippase GtrA